MPESFVSLDDATLPSGRSATPHQVPLDSGPHILSNPATGALIRGVPDAEGVLRDGSMRAFAESEWDIEYRIGESRPTTDV